MPTQPTIFTDLISTLQDGCNSGVEPLLLPKSQAAYIINGTCRGGYVTHRPPYFRLTLEYPSDEVQEAVESGFFQGAGWYRPDFGPLQIVAQVSGRLFTFTKGSSTSIYVVAEITIPGDPNNATANQAWMWQSEKWLIITDGTAKLPIFYDGVTTRRSYGPSQVLAIVDSGAAFPNPRVIGEVIEVTLTAPYTGAFNIPVLYNGEFYQTIQTASGGYEVELTNTGDTPGGTVPINTPIVVRATNPGTITSSGTVGAFVCKSAWECIVNLSSDYIGSLGDVLVLNTAINSGACGGTLASGSYAWTVTTISGSQIRVMRTFSENVLASIVTGQTISNQGNPTPEYIIGYTTAPFTVPAISATVTVEIDREYVGNDGQAVSINSQSYTIANLPPAPPSTTLFLQNLSDTSDAGDPIPVGDPDGNILSVPELPAGRMGAYGLGQNWMSLTDGIQFIASDVVGSAAGTPASNYRDAVLKTTGMTFFGGNFKIPTSGSIINSMTFTATLDTSLGQGPLQVGTDSSMFSCLAPFDFENPPDNRTPILTQSLIGFGPLAQNSTIPANSDTLFRIFPGLGSLRLARRDFINNEWGNTPISREMQRAFAHDNQTLLPFGSSVVHDNRFLSTSSPEVSAAGVFHRGLVALNFDLISSLRGKAPPVYDGLWTGLNVLQQVNIQSGSESRAFVFGYNLTDAKIELYELLNSADEAYADNGTLPITWVIETPVVFGPGVKPLNELVRLADGEIWLRRMRGEIHVKIQYRPDFYSIDENSPGCWVDWTEFDLCAVATGTNSRPSYKMPIGLGEPSGEPCETDNNRPFRVGHFFQIRIEITGSCKFMGLRLQAVQQPQVEFARPVCQPPELCEATTLLPELVIP